ncbi:MAG: FAD-dependent oxidoreductase [Treponemataceae bacterium]
MPVTETYDVVVVGSGPAGIAAAIGSARNKAKTLLVERYGIVGGNMTVGRVGPLMGKIGKGTLSDKLNTVLGTNTVTGQDFESLKTFLNNWLIKEGVELLLQTPVVDVIADGNTVQGLVVASASGPRIIKGACIVDASGDGTVAFLAGAEYEQGRDSDGLMQPVSLMFTVAAVDDATAIDERTGNYYARNPDSGYKALVEKAHTAGELPNGVSIVRLYRTVRSGECIINATHLCDISGISPQDLTRAEIQLRNQIPPICDFLRHNVDGFQNCYLKDSAETVGVRETRRIKGEYQLTDTDVLEGRKFNDVVVHDCNFIIDVHNPAGAGQAEDKPVPNYDIPYRCLIPLKIENLIMAGRCISGTHRANASFRVMNICLGIGQAAGTAAAISALTGTSPRKVDYHIVQKALTADGVVLFD